MGNCPRVQGKPIAFWVMFLTFYHTCRGVVHPTASDPNICWPLVLRYYLGLGPTWIQTKLF